jgi:tetratricopeptide (TPR) repeat protein
MTMSASVDSCWAQRSLLESLSKSGSDAYNKGNYREALRIMKQCLETEGATKPEQALLLINVGEAQRSLGQLKEAESTLKKALVLTDALPAKQRNYLTAFNNMALLYQQLGRFTEAEQLWKQSEQLAKKNDANALYPVNGLARHYNLWGKAKEQEEYIEKAQALAKKYPNTLAVPYYMLNAGQFLEQRGRYKDAEMVYKNALDVCTKKYGADHYYNGMILIEYSELLRKESRYADAEKILLAAQKIFEQQGSSEHPDLLQTMVRLAQVKCEQGKYAEARRLVESTIKTEETVFGGQDNSYVARAQDCLGAIYRQDGRYEDAQKILEQSLFNFTGVYGSEHIDVAIGMRHLAFVHEDQANFDEAESLLLKSQNIINNVTAAEHPERAKAAAALGRLYLRQGKYDKAEPLFKQSLELAEKVLGSESSVIASGAHDLGEMYLKQNKFADAQPYLEKALAIDEKVYGEKSAQVAGDLTSLASALAGQGQSEKAEPHLRRAADIKNVLPGGDKARDLEIPQALASSAGDRPVGDKWALVVGISNFKDSSINLKYAAKDATDFKNFLVSKANFKNDRVKLLTDEQATRENILGLLGDQWLATHVKPDDLVILYVSSHGSSAADEAGGTNFLVAHDTNKNSLMATGIPLQWLTKIVSQQVKSNRVILILDVCHSGAVGQGQKALLRAAGLDPRTMRIGKGQMVICSSLADQVSWESKNYENSVFTRRLIEALQADSQRTTMLQAYKRLKVAVESEVLRDRGDLQTPVLVSKEWIGGDAILAIPTAPRHEASK